MHCDNQLFFTCLEKNMGNLYISEFHSQNKGVADPSHNYIQLLGYVILDPLGVRKSRATLRHSLVGH